MIRLIVLAAAVALAAAPAAAQQQGVRRADGGILIDFPNTDMRLVVAALAEAAGLNVTWGDLPQRTVSLRTSTPVPPEQVRVYLESLLRANGMELRDEGGGLLQIVSTAPGAQAGAQPRPGQQPTTFQAAVPAGAIAIFVHPLRHAPAEDVARSIGALFGIGDGSYGGDRPRSLTDELRDQAIGPDGNMVAPAAQRAAQGLAAVLSGQVAIFPDQRTNSLLIRASQADYQTLAAAITQLDARPLQVLIEVVIAEVRRDRQFGLGVDFRIADQQVDGSDVVIGGELAGGGSAGDAVLRIMRLGAVDANVILRALSASGDVNILSRPVILAQNNEEARIMVGDQRPFIQISRALPTDNAARDQVIQYRDVGTRLTIRPSINPDGYVTLTVLQEVSSATDVTQFGAPVISTREAETRLLVKDGHTVVIGGLIDQVHTSTNSGVPFLKDIPLLGHLFRSTTRRTNTSELFLFLIPHVLYNDEEVDEATQRVRERAPRLDRVLPDSIPLYWESRTDTLEAPAAPPPGSRGPSDPGMPLPTGAERGRMDAAPSAIVVKVANPAPPRLSFRGRRHADISAAANPGADRGIYSPSLVTHRAAVTLPWNADTRGSGEAASALVVKVVKEGCGGDAIEVPTSPRVFWGRCEPRRAEGARRSLTLATGLAARVEQDSSRPPVQERMNSPLEIREVRLRGLYPRVGRGEAGSSIAGSLG